MAAEVDVFCEVCNKQTNTTSVYCRGLCMKANKNVIANFIISYFYDTNNHLLLIWEKNDKEN